MIKIINLRCGYYENPENINRDNICFSWSSEGAINQKAYRLQIAHDKFFKSIYIDTEKVKSSSNQFIKVKAKFSKSTRYFWRVKVYAEDDKALWSDIAHFDTQHGKFEAQWITYSDKRDPKSAAPSTRFRKDFINEDAEITCAKLYVSALGLYTCYINGKKCGDQYMTPGFTEYQSRVQYQTFDVTDLIVEGDNCISSVVSDGWYMGPLAGGNEDCRCQFGDQRAFFCQLEIFYNDDSYKLVATDNTWHSDMKGPYKLAEIYDGVDYDATYEDNFDLAGANTKPNVSIIKHKGYLVPMQGAPVKEIERIKPKEIITTPNGETVIDMGQNMVGVLELSVTGKKEDKVELYHFEVLDKEGNVYLDNLRSARQGLIYTLKEGENKFMPEMTFMGFRYVYVKSWPGDITLKDITAVVLSSANRRNGFFYTNDDMVNKLIENARWGQVDNYLDIPTDCPQRDERLGWTGDAHVFFETAAFNYDVLSFFNKWLGDMTFAQRNDGSIPHVIPNMFKDESSSAGWGECCIIIPWQLYVSYGDVDILGRFYPMMRDFMDYLATQCGTKHIRNLGFHFGDWLALEGTEKRDWGVTPKDFIATCFYGYCAQLMHKAAKVLGNQKDANRYMKLFKDIKAAFHKEFVTSSGRIVGHTQTAYVLALKFNMLEDTFRKRAIDELVSLIEDFSYITCGFMGSPYILHVLSDNGHHELAQKLALKKNYPSWLYPVTMGATTIWERWGSLNEDGAPDNRVGMNSFNHYAYGSVANWFYQKIAGIIPDESAPGYKHFFLRPHPSKELNNISTKLKTRYGTIGISYKLEEKNIYMDINIPDNTTCHLALPFCKAYILNSRRKRYREEILLTPGEYTLSYVMGGSMLNISIKEQI